MSQWHLQKIPVVKGKNSEVFHPLDRCEYSTPSMVTCWNLAWLFGLQVSPAMELKGKVSMTSRAGTYCSADVPVSEQLDGQGWDSPQAHRPHLIPSCSHCFLLVFCDSGDGSSSEMLSCRLMIPLLHFIYMDIIYTPSDNPKQPFLLLGVSAPWNSRTQFPWCSSQLLFGQPTHTVIPSSFFIILCSFFFYLFPSKLLTSS